MSGRVEPIHADDVATAPRVDDLGPAGDLGPGRGDRTSGPIYGNEYIQHGEPCARREGEPGCVLDADQRGRLVRQVTSRFMVVAANYGNAISAIQFAQLLESDDDLSWVAMLVLDVITFGVSSAISHSLKRMHAEGMKRLGKVALDANVPIGDHWVDVAQGAMRKVGGKSLEQGVEKAIGVAKGAMKSQLKGERRQLTRTAKAENLGYLESLKQQAERGFQFVREQAPASANDVELLALFDSLDVANHAEATYKALLQQKLARYKQSGVPEIGRKEARRMKHEDANPPADAPSSMEWAWTDAVLRDTRLVWIEPAAGRPKELRYEFQDGARVHPILHPGGEHHPSSKPPSFGAHEPITDAPELGGRVPVEFIDAALARHEQVWGGPPRTIRWKAAWFSGIERGVGRQTSGSRPASNGPVGSDTRGATGTPGEPQHDIVVPDALKLRPS